MGDPKLQSSNEIGILIGKILMGAAYILIGMLAKLAIDSRNQKLTRGQLWVKIIVMFFIGFISFVACDASEHIQWAGVVTPIATMLGETLALWILNNADNWLKKINTFLNKKQP